MGNGRITKKELRDTLKGVLVGVGAFIIYFPIRSWLMENFPLWVQFLAGGLLIYLALKKW